MRRVDLSFSFLMWCFAFLSCEGVRIKQTTPKEFLNRTIVSSNLYSRDSIKLIDELKEVLRRREGYFRNAAYFDSSQLIIDSILYSPDFEKIAVLVIVKNPTYRQLMQGNESKWYFDGTCFLGKRDSSNIKLFWLGPNFSNFSNRRLLSLSMRNSYFAEFATSDTTGKHLYKYNLNDIRFWDSSVWEEFKFSDFNRSPKLSFHNYPSFIDIWFMKHNHPNKSIKVPGGYCVSCSSLMRSRVGFFPLYSAPQQG